MSEVWENYPLQSLVIKVGSGSTPKGGSEAYKAVGIPLIRSMNVVFFGFKRAGLAYIDADQAAQLDNATVKAGDVLLNITGASIGRVTLAPDEFEGARVNQHVCIIRPNEALDARFLNAYLSSPSLQSQIWNDNFGVTRQALTKQQILDFEVPVPPRPEQTRIANQLDTLLTRVQACNDRFDAIPVLLKRFRQTVLGAATNGGLTAEWRTDPLAKKWVACTVGQVLNGKPRNGFSPQAVDYETSTRSLTLSATTTGKFLGRHSKFIAEPIAVDSHLWLEPGDILIQRANSLEYVGVSAIFDGLEKQFIYPDLMMKCRPNDRVKNKFLFYALSAESTRAYFRENATGTAGNMPKINQQTVMSAPLLLPPLDEQTEIVRRVEALFALADRIEVRYTVARTQAQRLSPLVLAKAFRGELVPQDPQDEPASALLARIAAQGATPAKKSQTKKPREALTPRAPKEATAMTKSRQDEDVKNKSYLADHLRRLATATTAEELFKASELPVADFYKQLAWEVAQGHIADGGTTLEARHAAG